MLGKLLKYEIRAMGRIMLPLYLVMIFIAGLFAVNMRMSMSGNAKALLEKFALITGFLFFAAIMAVGVVMLIMVIQRFYRNLLGTEGYLMFTLPVTTLQHIISKALTSLIWIVIGIAAGAAAGFLMVGILSNIPEFMKELQDAWKMFFSTKDLAAKVILLVIFLIVGITESLCKVYAAMAVGHQLSSHRVIGSVGAYIGFGIVELILGNILSADNALFGKLIGTFNQAFSTIPNSVLIQLIIVSVIGTAVYGVLAWFLLDRHLNLE